jgi:sugar/nucleoside kinase (ribokinase family)
MGSDAMSHIARSELVRHGVLDDFFIHDEASTPGISVVEIEPLSGERTVLYSLKGYGSLKNADIPLSEVKRARLILVDGYETEAALTMLEAIQGTPCHSVLDIEAGDPQTLRRLIELGTHIILPLAAALRLSGQSEVAEALRELSTWTTGQIIATDGVNGSWACTVKGIHHQPAFKVEALDTTGCGDAYHGAYACALLDELPLPLRMELASWIAAQVALKLGGRSNLPTRESLKRRNLAELSSELRRHVES